MKGEVIAAIHQKIAVAEKRIAQLKELCKPIAPENAIGRVSRMDAINNKSMNEAALQQTEITLQKLKIALSKVDEPNFGKCYNVLTKSPWVGYCPPL